MVRTRVRGYSKRVREELHDAFTEDHTPRQTAGSFAVGTFITMLPTLGIGLALFLVIAYVFESASKLALFASVVVFNPVVKWGVYASSFALGVFLLGPIEGVTMADVSLNAGSEIVVRLVVGNVILAIVATMIGYVAVYRLACRYDETEIVETIDELVDERLEA